MLFLLKCGVLVNAKLLDWFAEFKERNEKIKSILPSLMRFKVLIIFYYEVDFFVRSAYSAGIGLV